MAKDNQCYLRRNKEARDKQPEYKGNGIVGGVEYWLSAWVNVDEQTGEKYFSVKFSPKTEAKFQPKPVASDEFNDQIPF